MKKVSKLKIQNVSFEEFTDYEFIPPGSFYIRNAMGDYVFVKTADRLAAQNYINDVYGKGKYSVVSAKLDKGQVNSESGEYSVRGTATRSR